MAQYWWQWVIAAGILAAYGWMLSWKRLSGTKGSSVPGVRPRLLLGVALGAAMSAQVVAMLTGDVGASLMLLAWGLVLGVIGVWLTRRERRTQTVSVM